MYKGHKADLPHRRYLDHWQQVCGFIDAEPYRAIRFPYTSADPTRQPPPISARLLQRMSKFGLVRHRITDCTWRLSPKWQDLLHRLALGLPEEAKPEPAEQSAQPFLAAYGVDTMYVNILADDLPPRLIAHLTHFKDLALANNDTALTPWLFAGVPLSMYKSGKGTSGKRGVSWGYILRNDLIEVKLRKVAVSGIIGMVRLSAQVLWEQTPRIALDRMKGMARQLWADPVAFKAVGYQLSQVHLCADIANFTLTPDVLGRLISHSLSQTLHVPSDEEDNAPTIRAIGDDDPDDYLYDDPPEDYLDPSDYFDDEEDEADDEQEETEEDDDDDDEDESPAWAEGGAGIHLFGKRVQGFTFSPKAPLSAAWYDKARELRISGKGWMRAIHENNGWQPGMPITRIEPRFKRPLMRELDAHLAPTKERWFDDPWVALDHYGELWAFYGGLSPEADTAPDVTHRGWMRLAQPMADLNRSRWPNDPVWDLVQRVPFNQSLPKPLKRTKRRDPALDHLYAETYGMLKTIAVLRGSYLNAPAELPRELEALEDWAEAWQEQRGEAFPDGVRERARMLGKPLPLSMLPKLPSRRTEDAS